jgi:phospholipid-binding lipoprotein MlaA
MKWFACSILLLLFLLPGCAHSSGAVFSAELPAAFPRLEEVAAASSPEQIPLNPAQTPALSGGGAHEENAKAVKEMAAAMPGTAASGGQSEKPDSLEGDYDASANYVEEGGDQEGERIADPLEPFNRAMYHFNDKLYFWVLKPVARGYRFVIPEVARIGVSNFFTNIAFPIRFVNCLLQANFTGAGKELARFMLNTLAGFGGFWDHASRGDVGLTKQDEDFGQTLGVYGVGQGFYINWPILGPSSPRDTLGLVGDYFSHPFFYYDGPWLITWELRVYDKVNDTSLRIGDYEALKEAAIDPYVAIRDAYVQYRLKKVREMGGPNSSIVAPGGQRREDGQ